MQRLDGLQQCFTLAPVSVLQIKQSLSRLSAKDQREIQIYLHQLKRRTPAWKKATAKKVREMQQGKFTTLEELKVRSGKR
jgi:hypothetical protein